MFDESSSRRRFLTVIGHGGLVASATSLGVACSSSGISGTYPAGNVSQLSVGELAVAPSGPLAIGRDSGGVYAMTLICTHSGCDMATSGSVSSQGIACFCHGSRFDVNGNPIAGPAPSPLQHYEVTIDASGAMTINGDAPVPEATRTPAG